MVSQLKERISQLKEQQLQILSSIKDQEMLLQNIRVVIQVLGEEVAKEEEKLKLKTEGKKVE